MSNIEAKEPLLKIDFEEDKSEFILSEEWEDVFVDYFGPNPEVYPTVAQRIRFVAGKYVEHKAWPSKFDGLQYTGDEDEGKPSVGDEKYDDPEFYWEHWDNWTEEDRMWGFGENLRRLEVPPKCAEVAEAVLYQGMRGGLLQKVLQQMGAKTQVVTPKQFLQILDDQQKDPKLNN